MCARAHINMHEYRIVKTIMRIKFWIFKAKAKHMCVCVCDYMSQTCYHYFCILNIFQVKRHKHWWLNYLKKKKKKSLATLFIDFKLFDFKLWRFVVIAGFSWYSGDRGLYITRILFNNNKRRAHTHRERKRKIHFLWNIIPRRRWYILYT